MTIKFKRKQYNLVSTPNISKDRFQASIDRTDVSVDGILNDLDGFNKITITTVDAETEEESVETYDQYTDMLAVAVYKDVISVELLEKEEEIEETAEVEEE